MTELCLTKCFSCRQTIQITGTVNTTRCNNCGFNFMGELVEVEFVSLEDLIEAELDACADGLWS